MVLLMSMNQNTFSPFARYDPSLFNLIRCYEPFGREWVTLVVIFSYDCIISHANNCKHINRGINPTGQR